MPPLQTHLHQLQQLFPTLPSAPSAPRQAALTLLTSTPTRTATPTRNSTTREIGVSSPKDPRQKQSGTRAAVCTPPYRLRPNHQKPSKRRSHRLQPPHVKNSNLHHPAQTSNAPTPLLLIPNDEASVSTALSHHRRITSTSAQLQLLPHAPTQSMSPIKSTTVSQTPAPTSP